MNADELVELAARRGISDLALASPGRLRVHIADDRDLFDMFVFQRAATDLLRAEITVYSDGRCANARAITLRRTCLRTLRKRCRPGRFLRLRPAP